MTKFLLTVDYQKGAVETPMTEWSPEEITAHLHHYRVLLRQLAESGELVEDRRDRHGAAKIVTWDGVTSPVVNDGPFAEFKEMLAGCQLVDVESEEGQSRSRPRSHACPNRANGHCHTA
jgi:hypothetical protein